MQFNPNEDLKKVYILRSMTEWILEMEDQYIIETVSEIRSKSKWDCNEATTSLQNICLKEWRRRHGAIPMPKILPEIEMILSDDQY